MFCRNCGEKINTRFCTNCGYDNNMDNKSKKNDEVNVGLNIVGFIFPFVGLILFLCLKKDAPNKAKKIGKWSLIGTAVRLILAIIFALLTIVLILCFDFVDSEDSSFEPYYNYENYDYDGEEDIDAFNSAVDYYVLLASKRFYQDAYTNRELTSVCYSIKDLEKTSYYDGSIMTEMIDGDLKITIWLTDYVYVIDGIDYDDYKITDIKKGDKVSNSCLVIDNNNSV